MPAPLFYSQDIWIRTTSRNRWRNQYYMIYCSWRYSTFIKSTNHQTHETIYRPDTVTKPGHAGSVVIVPHTITTILKTADLSTTPSGGRYKKEVLVDGQSHLLLIREESGLPNAQVLHVFVLSIKNHIKCTLAHVLLHSPV